MATSPGPLPVPGLVAPPATLHWQQRSDPFDAAFGVTQTLQFSPATVVSFGKEKVALELPLASVVVVFAGWLPQLMVTLAPLMAAPVLASTTFAVTVTLVGFPASVAVQVVMRGVGCAFRLLMKNTAIKTKPA